MIGYPIWERIGTPYFEKLPFFLQNYRFCEITVFEKLPFLQNYRFGEIIDFFNCTFIQQKCLLEAIIALAPQLKWSDTSP